MVLVRNGFVTYLGTGCLDKSNNDTMKKSLFIMMEYMNQGTLGDLLVRQMARPRKPLYTREQALIWLLQIARALNTLHTATPKVRGCNVRIFFYTIGDVSEVYVHQLKPPDDVILEIGYIPYKRTTARLGNLKRTSGKFAEFALCIFGNQN